MLTDLVKYLRLIVVLELQRGADGKFYIKRQEDFYQPDMCVLVSRLPLLSVR